MAKFKKFFRIACMLCLLLSVVLLAAGCKDEPDTTAATVPQAENTVYTISVHTAGGMIPGDVMVYVYKDASRGSLVDLPKKLDNQGKYTFTAPQSDAYTVVLSGLPDGYDVQDAYTITGTQMEILLTSAPIAGEAPANIYYSLGDIIYDYSITTIDGVTYTISDILKEKNAVVLNFWYVKEHLCMDEFPYLQAAYAKHSENVEVLALNIDSSDSDEQIRGVIDEYGLTFPVAKADDSMLTAMQSTACPTTVIIDRYGMISFMYTGGISDPAYFPALLRHFGEADRTQGIVDTSDDTLDAVEALVKTEDIPYGCVQYPYQVGAQAEHVGEVRANELVYYILYRTTGSTLRIEDPDVYLVWEGKTYYPKDGVLEMNFFTDNHYDGITIQLGTTSGVDKTVILKQVAKPGSSENPYVIELGDMTLLGGAENSYYTFTSEYAGTFTITVGALPAGVACRMNMTNLRTNYVTDATSEESIDPETGLVTFSISVEAGDTVRIIFDIIGEGADSAELDAHASIPEIEGADEGYSILVTDENGNPISNVLLSVNVKGTEVPGVTDENGLLHLDLRAGTYSVTLTLPEGYYATTQYLLTPAKKTLSIVLVSTREYTVQVSLANGTLTGQVTVNIYTNDSLEELICTGILDENGRMVFSYGNIENCVAVLAGLPSNVYVQSSYPLTGEITEITLISTSIGDTNASNQHYQLGDKIADFSITTPDGRVYSIYEILEAKKAVVLTFWHSSSTASHGGFVALQDAYNIYSDRLEILAMNPLDKSDATIATYQALLDLSFPMAQCSSQWESAMHLTVYPTMVVIDREGVICLVHSGSVTDANVLQLVFDHYTAEEYDTTVVSSIQELLPPDDQPNGTQENPYIVTRGTQQMTVELAAGADAYYTFEELEPLGIRVEGAGAYIVLDGITYESVDGVVQVEINITGSQEPVTVIIGNAGTGKVSMQITLTMLAAG